MRPSKPIIHGTANAYGNGDCRCEACRTAWRTYNRRVRGLDRINVFILLVRLARIAYRIPAPPSTDLA